MSLFRERLNELYQERQAQADREKRKYSVTAFAAEVGITRQAMTKYLNGDTSKETNYPCFPDIPMFEKLCDTFSVSADWLLGRSDIRTPDTGTIAVCETTGLSEESVSVLSETKKCFDEYSNSTSVNPMAITIDTLLKNPKFIELIFHYLYDDHKSLFVLNDDHKLGEKTIAIVHAENVSEYHLSDFEGLARIRLLDTLAEFRKELEPERQNLNNRLAHGSISLLPITNEDKEAQAEYINIHEELEHKAHSDD